MTLHFQTGLNAYGRHISIDPNPLPMALPSMPILGHGHVGAVQHHTNNNARGYDPHTSLPHNFLHITCITIASHTP